MIQQCLTLFFSFLYPPPIQPQEAKHGRKCIHYPSDEFVIFFKVEKLLKRL